MVYLLKLATQANVIDFGVVLTIIARDVYGEVKDVRKFDNSVLERKTNYKLVKRMTKIVNKLEGILESATVVPHYLKFLISFDVDIVKAHVGSILETRGN